MEFILLYSPIGNDDCKKKKVRKKIFFTLDKNTLVE